MTEAQSKAVEEALSKARMEWNSEQSSIMADEIVTAKREWMKDQNDELEKRLANAIEEVRRIWDEEQKLKTKEVSVSMVNYVAIQKRLGKLLVAFVFSRS